MSVPNWRRIGYDREKALQLCACRWLAHPDEFSRMLDCAVRRIDALEAAMSFERDSAQWLAIDRLDKEEITMMRCLELLRESVTPNKP